MGVKIYKHIIRGIAKNPSKYMDLDKETYKYSSNPTTKLRHLIYTCIAKAHIIRNARDEQKATKEST